MSTPGLAAAAAFDALAPTYDRFSQGSIGRHMRAAVRQRMLARFRIGDRVLELNCGTGDDAVWLAEQGMRVLATDVSAGMLEVAESRVLVAGVQSQVELRQVAIEAIGSGCDGFRDWRERRAGTNARGDGEGEPGEYEPGKREPGKHDRDDGLSNRITSVAVLDALSGLGTQASDLRSCPVATPHFYGFDGLLSNFGGLNCVGVPLSDVFAQLAHCVRPGGFALLCVMGPRVPWEWVWYLARRQPAIAFRRRRAEGTMWRGVRVTYPSIRTLTRASAPWFVRRRVSAVGAFVPPSYTEGWASRHPRLLDSLARLERRFETTWPLPSLADHYLIELERTTVATAPRESAAASPRVAVAASAAAGGTP